MGLRFVRGVDMINARFQLNITQKELAEVIGVTVNTVRRAEQCGLVNARNYSKFNIWLRENGGGTVGKDESEKAGG